MTLFFNFSEAVMELNIRLVFEETGHLCGGSTDIS